MTRYVDVSALEESTRIAAIVAELRKGQKVGVMVDDAPGKVDRYVRKILQESPTSRLLMRGPFGTPGVVALTFGPKLN